MENATKALAIAGSVLIAVLILGILVYTYNRISDIKNTEYNTKVVEQSKDFNKAYENYNRKSVYGSELFSLANQMEDYNEKEATQKGYDQINLSVQITSVIIEGASQFKPKTYDLDAFAKAYNKLAEEINEKGTNVYRGKTLSYWANSSSELKHTFTDSTSLTQMMNRIKEYNKLVTEQTDTARLTFKCTNVEYDMKTGRITEMDFIEN